ncbi:MAG: PsbP-related protein [Deltaproteobacteria bacterium]|nr:PsbP-related protein [Deltaproteobacteria bacterium]
MRRTTPLIILIICLLLPIHSGLGLASPKTSNNLYNDAKYKFKIIFPRGWNLTKGYTEGGIVVQAVEKKHGSNIAIIVKNLPKNYTAEMMSEKEVAKFMEGVKRSSPDAVLLSSAVTKIDNRKAFMLKHAESYSFLGIKVAMKILTFLTVNNEKLFIINCGTLPELYGGLENTFIETVSTFSFGR